MYKWNSISGGARRGKIDDMKSNLAADPWRPTTENLAGVPLGDNDHPDWSGWYNTLSGNQQLKGFRRWMDSYRLVRECGGEQGSKGLRAKAR